MKKYLATFLIVIGFTLSTTGQEPLLMTALACVAKITMIMLGGGILASEIDKGVI